MKQIANFGGSTTSGGTTKETIAKVKSTRETITSSTTLQDDNDFVFAVKANTTYAINASLYISSGGGGFKWVFSIPSGATGRVNTGAAYDVGSGAVIVSPSLDTSVSVGQGNSANYNISGNSGLPFTGFIATGSTAGNITFQWAQGTSNATGTYIERGSTMILTEV